MIYGIILTTHIDELHACSVHLNPIIAPVAAPAVSAAMNIIHLASDIRPAMKKPNTAAGLMRQPHRGPHASIMTKIRKAANTPKCVVVGL